MRFFVILIILVSPWGCKERGTSESGTLASSKTEQQKPSDCTIKEPNQMDFADQEDFEEFLRRRMRWSHEVEGGRTGQTYGQWLVTTSQWGQLVVPERVYAQDLPREPLASHFDSQDEYEEFLRRRAEWSRAVETGASQETYGLWLKSNNRFQGIPFTEKVYAWRTILEPDPQEFANRARYEEFLRGRAEWARAVETGAFKGSYMAWLLKASRLSKVSRVEREYACRAEA